MLDRHIIDLRLAIASHDRAVMGFFLYSSNVRPCSATYHSEKALPSASPKVSQPVLAGAFSMKSPSSVGSREITWVGLSSCIVADDLRVCVRRWLLWKMVGVSRKS